MALIDGGKGMTEVIYMTTTSFQKIQIKSLQKYEVFIGEEVRI